MDRGKSVLSPNTQRHAVSEGVCAALSRMPFFACARPGIVHTERLNGALTNHSYKVTTQEGIFVLRLAGEGTGEYVNRAAEGHNARVAASAGVNAEVIHFDTKAGTMLTRFVDAVPMDGKDLVSDRDALARAALALARVHRLGRVFRFRFDVFARVNRYLDLLFGLGMPPPESYYELHREAEAIRLAMQASPAPLVPCHNDPWPGNLLDTGERVYIIDWEYSGMNDPAWDLADLSVEAGLGPEQELAMLDVYHGGPTPPALSSRLALYKAMSDLHWALWAFVQHANGNPAEDFLSYALGRLARCERWVGDPDFGRHLGVVLTGSDGPRSPGRACLPDRSGEPGAVKLRGAPPRPVKDPVFRTPALAGTSGLLDAAGPP